LPTLTDRRRVARFAARDDKGHIAALLQQDAALMHPQDDPSLIHGK
jgi:hypothetical protein